MTRKEWIEIGYDKKIIEDYKDDDCITFKETYNKWFLMKMHKIKPQSLDRIECTWNKYYKEKDICNIYLHDIDEKYIYNFLNEILQHNKVNSKEFKRIYQIVNNVMVYAYDLSLGYANLLNWNLIKRMVFDNEIDKRYSKEYMVSSIDRQTIYKEVVYNNIYPEKRSSALALVLNFYLGLRVGELAALKFKDFDLNNKVLKVERTQVKYFPRDENGERQHTMIYAIVNDLKTENAFRYVPLTDECIKLYQMIKAHHEVRGYNSEYICYDGKDTILERSVARTLTRLCVLCGVEHINSHRIRKTYASSLHNQNIPTRIIADLMGHADTNTTEKIYILGYEDINIYRGQIEAALSEKEFGVYES